MGRAIRPNVPGGVFHLTARTLRRQRWFTPAVRTGALDVLACALPASDLRLLAVVIMPNHLHLVVQQGRYPVGRFMQSLLRRLVHIIHRQHGLEGPVFWRPYGYTPCVDPEHARNAIAYTHLNPVRGGLCADPSAYPWSSHALYLPEHKQAEHKAVPEFGQLTVLVDPCPGLRLFTARDDRPVADSRVDYERYVEWRRARDHADAEDSSPPAAPPDVALPLAWGDPRWSSALSPLFHARPTPTRRWSASPDLADIARATLAAECPGLQYQEIRGRRGGRTRSRLRHLVIERAHAAGHRNVDIARFLDLSESAVSKVVCTVASD